MMSCGWEIILSISNSLLHGSAASYVAGLDRLSFLASEEKQDAVIRNIEIIGEAAQSIRRHHPEFAARHPEIPWGGIYGMRNAIAHGYFAVDLEVVWKTLCEDLPALGEQIRALRGALQNDPGIGD
jgi:uncharacterized protein with HEPN domain